nr:hypothetical protein [Methanomassiliicoccus luminyensis]
MYDLTLASRSGILTGLDRTSFAPARIISSPFTEAKALTPITTARGSIFNISLVASMPSISGISMSMSTSWGLRSAYSCTARRPFSASTTSYPSSISLRTSRMKSSSSAIRIRGRIHGRLGRFWLKHC